MAAAGEPARRPGASHRLESLDVFRGLTVAGMILVNNPGSWDAVYTQLLHTDWNGCTIADVVFPFFIFIVGVATHFAFSRRREAGFDRGRLYRRIVQRTVVLVALGVLLNAVEVAPRFAGLRFPGVLQRIGLVYFAAAMIVLHTRTAGRVMAIVVLLIGHWALLTLLPFGGHAAGTLTPAANLPAYVDRLVFGAHTLTPLGDPEGLIGTLPAIASALLGELAGAWLRSTPSVGRRIVGLIIGGTTLTIAGLAWSNVLPINKPLWTGSYALLTAGLAATLLCACYMVIDVAKVRSWAAPFLWLGVNPLAIYFLSEFVGHLLERTIKWRIYWNGFLPLLGGVLSQRGISFVMSLCTVILWVALAGVLHKRGIHVHV